MTFSATVKVGAIRLLRASILGGAHAGDALGPHLWPGKVEMRTKFGDCAAGLDYAVQHGWIEKLPRDQYRLTEPGFACISIDDIIYGPIHRNGTPEQQNEMHIAIKTSGGDKQRAIDEFLAEQRRLDRDLTVNVDAIYDWCKAHPLP
jgi:hypothetical protein